MVEDLPVEAPLSALGMGRGELSGGRVVSFLWAQEGVSPDGQDPFCEARPKSSQVPRFKLATHCSFAQNLEWLSFLLFYYHAALKKIVFHRNMNGSLGSCGISRLFVIFHTNGFQNVVFSFIPVLWVVFFFSFHWTDRLNLYESQTVNLANFSSSLL